MDYSEFKKFGKVINEHMPLNGEGETFNSQICTAVNKLVYKWFNDGDVYDNRYELTGWVNDISSYANWLYQNFPGSQETLEMIEDVKTEPDYEELLYRLCVICIGAVKCGYYDGKSKVGSIYDSEGPFAFIVMNWEDE